MRYTESMIPLLFLPMLALAVFFLGMYAVALLRTDNSVADVAWGIGFIIVAVSGLFVNQAFWFKPLLVLALVTIWGMRLAIHIFQRNLGKGEDFRYKAWREQWGHNAWLKSFLQVFLLQAIFLLIVSLPIQITMRFARPAGFELWDAIGLGIWLLGFYFESVGDAQLAAFKRDPNNKGKILQTGLWSITRHPNYFGESLMWWGIATIASSLTYGWYGFIGAMTITFMVRFISGVPLLEKKYAGRPDWEAYVKKTAVFIPYLHL